MNKYANQYFDNLDKQASWNINGGLQNDTIPSSAIVAGSMGALGAKGLMAGGTIGALSGAIDPGVDEQGHQKSRIKEALKRMLAGGAVGLGVGAAAGIPVGAITAASIPKYT